MTYKLGSLFDGSGGFPLAGSLCGIEPVWAAEIEPYPIAVTRSRFPRMKHLGDISKINGAEIEPVDIITFGSPCQDLSVAGKRAGLKHEANGDDETTRSGLFMEAVRIIKEMREATNGEHPRLVLWENVPGAISSNSGNDFRIVLEELIRIIEPDATMPPVPKAGWAYADSYVLDGGSLAYRVFDAQYWGVPQRRRRIHLVADFRGTSAREILFEHEGLRGYYAEGRTPWQNTSPDAQGSSGADDCKGEGFDGYNGDLTGDKSATLGVNCGVSTGRNGVIERARQLDAVIDSHILDDQGGSVMSVRTDGKAPTLRAQMGGHPPVVMSPAVVYAVDQGGGKSGANVSEGTAPTLCTTHGGEPAVAYANPAHYIVRRLTPTECARLQGFADWWSYLEAVDSFSQKDYQFWLDVRHTHEVVVKGKDPKDLKDYTVKQMLTWYNKLWTDSAEYKMWGNGIALPPALYCMQGITDVLNRDEEEDSWML